MTNKPVTVGELVDVPWLNSVAISVYNTILGAATGTIDTGAVLPTTYKHMLVILSNARGDTAAASLLASLRFNGDSGNNYYGQRISGSATTTTSAESLTQSALPVGDLPANTALAGLSGSCIIWVPGYATGSLAKAVFSCNSAPTNSSTGTIFTEIRSGFWNNGAAINRVAAVASAGNFIVGTQMTVCMVGS